MNKTTADGPLEVQVTWLLIIRAGRYMVTYMYQQ